MDRTKVYMGDRRDRHVIVWHNGHSYELHHVSHHSPDGFNWGYGGSGPADLARSILCDLVGERPSKDDLYWGNFKSDLITHYQRFKWAMIAPLDIDSDFVLKAEDIINWLEKEKLLEVERVG